MKTSYKIFILLIFLTLGFAIKTSFANAYTCTVVAGGGNWNAAGTWSGCNSTIPQTSDSVVLDGTSGNLAVNANTNSLKSLVMTGYTGTMSGSNNITVFGSSGTTQNIILDGIITWTGTLILSNGTATSNIDITTNGKLLTAVNINHGAAATTRLLDNMSFTAIKTATLLRSSSLGTFDMNGFTISGNSTTNRVLISSGTLGTQRTINRNGGAFANADFRDIDLEAVYDCSAITGLCGNAGGNSADFTFTTAATQTWSGTSGGNWSTNAWTSRVPLPQDNVIIASAFSSAQTVTTDMPRGGHSIDWTGTTWSGTAVTWDIDSTATFYGSITMVANMTQVNNGNVAVNFETRTGTSTIISAGVSWQSNFTILSAGGIILLGDAFVGIRTITLTNGTFDTGNFSVTSAGFISTSGLTRTLTMGSSTWTTNTTGASTWSISTSGLTFTANTSTIVVSNTTSTSKTFAGGGATAFNIVTFSGDNITVTGSNTFATMNINNAGLANGLKITSATTQTITSSFTSNGSAGNLAILKSATTGSAAILSKTTGIIVEDYMSIQDSTAAGGATWYAGSHSTNVSGNSGWIFGDQSGARPASIPSENVRGGTKVRGGVKFR